MSKYIVKTKKGYLHIKLTPCSVGSNYHTGNFLKDKSKAYITTNKKLAKSLGKFYSNKLKQKSFRIIRVDSILDKIDTIILNKMVRIFGFNFNIATKKKEIEIEYVKPAKVLYHGIECLVIDFLPDKVIVIDVNGKTHEFQNKAII